MPVSMYTVSIPSSSSSTSRAQHRARQGRGLGRRAKGQRGRSFEHAAIAGYVQSDPTSAHAANAAGRLAGKELLKFANDETTIAQLKDRIAKTVDYLKSVKQSEIDGTEGKDISITFPSGQTRQFTGQSLLLGNSLPNFWFHTTTAYDIVRQCGVEVGKRDFMGTPPKS